MNRLTPPTSAVPLPASGLRWAHVRACLRWMHDLDHHRQMRVLLLSDTPPGLHEALAEEAWRQVTLITSDLPFSGARPPGPLNVDLWCDHCTYHRPMNPQERRLYAQGAARLLPEGALMLLSMPIPDPHRPRSPDRMAYRLRVLCEEFQPQFRLVRKGVERLMIADEGMIRMMFSVWRRTSAEVHLERVRVRRGAARPPHVIAASNAAGPSDPLPR